MEFEDIITSKSRYAVLKVLALRRTPLHLRAIAEVSNLSPRGTQLACDYLVKAKVITSIFEGNKKFFALNPKAVLAPIIKAHFAAERDRRLAKRANNYKNGAAVLDQVNQITLLAWNSRR